MRLLPDCGGTEITNNINKVRWAISQLSAYAELNRTYVRRKPKSFALAAALIETKAAAKAEPPKPVQSPESRIEKGVRGIR